ncbi:MAG: hypothetical protein ACREBD_19950 [Blastocatellia bacterium]
MATNQLDLWPTMTATATTRDTPVSILREQAALLEKKTNGVVIADVEMRSSAAPGVLSAALSTGMTGERARDAIAYSFYLIAPALENYRYLLFWMFQPIEMYPLFIRDSPEGDIKVESENEFVEALRRIFGSEKTQSVVQAIIAQSNS